MEPGWRGAAYVSAMKPPSWHFALIDPLQVVRSPPGSAGPSRYHNLWSEVASESRLVWGQAALALSLVRVGHQ